MHTIEFHNVNRKNTRSSIYKWLSQGNHMIMKFSNRNFPDWRRWPTRVDLSLSIKLNKQIKQKSGAKYILKNWQFCIFNKNVHQDTNLLYELISHVAPDHALTFCMLGNIYARKKPNTHNSSQKSIYSVSNTLIIVMHQVKFYKCLPEQNGKAYVFRSTQSCLNVLVTPRIFQVFWKNLITYILNGKMPFKMQKIIIFCQKKNNKKK